ncbi:MAG TPA: hypothetical protein PK847_00290, partial [Candidatus Sumerlaeota bacterium]|nr:hypothetical protein [Candidatus Sumerlaeota bacterium]
MLLAGFEDLKFFGGGIHADHVLTGIAEHVVVLAGTRRFFQYSQCVADGFGPFHDIAHEEGHGHAVPLALAFAADFAHGQAVFV